MQHIILFLQIILGLVFFWAFEAHKYIINGSFRFSKWKSENLAKFVWTLIVCVFVMAIMIVDPASIGFVFKSMGIDLQSELGNGEFSLSGVVIGILISYVTQRLLKKKKVKVVEDTTTEVKPEHEPEV